MATTESVRLHIAGIGHVLYAPVGTPFPDVSKLKFGDESTYGGFTWMGDISSENVIEFETDGGDVTFKRTHDRLKVRAVREDQTTTGTINSVNISKEVFDIAFGGGEYVESTDSYKVKSTSFAKDYAILFFSEDGIDIAGLGLPNTSVMGSFPTFDIENFVELPLNLAIQSDTDQTLWEQFFPRPYAGAEAAGAAEAEPGAAA